MRINSSAEELGVFPLREVLQGVAPTLKMLEDEVDDSEGGNMPEGAAGGR